MAISKKALEYAKQAYITERDCIGEMLDFFDDEQFSKAVELLKSAPRIAASGCGHSGILCRHFAHLMCCIELSARFISPAEAVHGGTGFLKKGSKNYYGNRKHRLTACTMCRRCFKTARKP